jgi:hypothetical protein
MGRPGDDIAESERADLMSCRQQDLAFQAALRREVLAGRERVTACPAPAASTSRDGAQRRLDAAEAQRAGHTQKGEARLAGSRS